MIEGTAKRCDCHGREVLAVVNTERQFVEVRDRRNREVHVGRLSLDQIVRMMDPAGTTYQRVPTGSA